MAKRMFRGNFNTAQTEKIASAEIASAQRAGILPTPKVKAGPVRKAATSGPNAKVPNQAAVNQERVRQMLRTGG